MDDDLSYSGASLGVALLVICAIGLPMLCAFMATFNWIARLH
jgi:hypothetical protein